MPSPPSAALATTTPPNTSLNLQVQSADDLQRLARLFAASGLFGRSGNAEAHMAECAIKILAGMEAGFGPFASAAGVSVINGRPGFGANLLAQAIKRHPMYDYRVLEKTSEVCRIKFLSGKEELGVETFTIEMARRAGLVKSTGPWAQYPEAMLFARCLSAGMRTHCPDALGGATAYTPEELGADGDIQLDGSVTVTVAEVEPPKMLTTTEDLVAGAERACIAKGLTPDGIVALCQEIGQVSSLSELPKNMLARLAKNGVSAATVERCNAAAVATDPDPESDNHELPAAWAQ